VQVDHIKPILKPPGTNHLKLNCDTVLSTFAFKFNLRRYNVERAETAYATGAKRASMAGRCRLILSIPR
jgi:hypothetical protein